MNKTELVNAIAQKTGQSASSVGEVLAAFEGSSRMRSPAATRSNCPASSPSTGPSALLVPAATPPPGRRSTFRQSTVPRVKAGKTFKDAVGK